MNIVQASSLQMTHNTKHTHTHTNTHARGKMHANAAANLSTRGALPTIAGHNDDNRPENEFSPTTAAGCLSKLGVDEAGAVIKDVWCAPQGM